jgi:hypothetical protein
MSKVIGALVRRLACGYVVCTTAALLCYCFPWTEGSQTSGLGNAGPLETIRAYSQSGLQAAEGRANYEYRLWRLAEERGVMVTAQDYLLVIYPLLLLGGLAFCVVSRIALQTVTSVLGSILLLANLVIGMPVERPGAPPLSPDPWGVVVAEPSVVHRGPPVVEDRTRTIWYWVGFSATVASIGFAAMEWENRKRQEGATLWQMLLKMVHDVDSDKSVF